VVVTLGEITDRNREAVLALRVAPGQELFGSVRSALAEAAEYPHAKPWYRAVCTGGQLVGFVMASSNVEPQPPEIIGPWLLWKLLIDERHQGRGCGAEVVRQVAELVRAEDATELLTSYVPQDGGPAGFYEQLRFVPTGELDGNGEAIVRLALPSLRAGPPTHGSGDHDSDGSADTSDQLCPPVRPDPLNRPVHDFGAAPQFGHDHLPADRLGRHRALVASQAGYVLERHPAGAEQRDERMPHLPPRPVTTQADSLCDLAELAAHVVTIELCAND
jgi:diamine N-acetyltransferase